MKHLTKDPGRAGDGGTDLVPKSLRDAVARYRGWIIVTTVAVTTLVTLWTLRIPKVYQAVTTLEYNPDPANPLGRDVEGFSGSASHFLMSREFFETQNLVIQSRVVAERVAENFGLADSPDFFGRDDDTDWVPVSVSEAAEVLQNRTRIDPIKDTRLVRLEVRDRNPERAATLANAIVDAYIEKTLADRLGTTAAAADWLAQQLGSTREQLTDAENALQDFKREHNVLSLSLEKGQSLLAREIQEYNERLTDVRARRIELEAHLARLKSARANPDAIEESGNREDTELDTLRRGLREKLTERAALSVRYGDAHPTIRELEGQIASLRKSLRAEVSARIRTAEGDLREAKAIEAGLSKAQQQSKQAGIDLNQREIEYSRLNRQRESNAQLYDLLLQRTAEADLTRLLRTTHVRVVDQALVPVSPVSPILPLNIAGGLLGGLFLGIGFAWILNLRDRGVRDLSDVEALGLTVLGVFPHVGDAPSPPRYASMARRERAPPASAKNVGTIVHTNPMSTAAESCRTLRTNLTFMSVDSPVNTLVITSADPKDGKTTLATNLAIAFAQGGQRVLLIDADLRRPRVHEGLNLENEYGLTNALVGEQRLADVTQPTEVDNLFVVTSGPLPPNPAELLHTPSFKRLLNEAQSQFDRVIFDSPPLRAVTDAAVLAPQCAGTLLVVRAEITTREEVQSAIRSLRDVNANVVGGVLNDVTVTAGKGMQAKQGYYHYVQSSGYGGSDTGSGGHSQSAA
ncbi:MAG: polysaccharide biosynthesis tyrosine autokinase [Myxococcota bacterium]